jgi:hypothetical protein
MSVRIFDMKSFNKLEIDEYKIKQIAEKPKKIIRNSKNDYLMMFSNLDTFYYENNNFLK